GRRVAGPAWQLAAGGDRFRPRHPARRLAPGVRALFPCRGPRQRGSWRHGSGPGHCARYRAGTRRRANCRKPARHRGAFRIALARAAVGRYGATVAARHAAAHRGGPARLSRCPELSTFTFTRPTSGSRVPGLATWPTPSVFFMVTGQTKTWTQPPIATESWTSPRSCWALTRRPPLVCPH